MTLPVPERGQSSDSRSTAPQPRQLPGRRKAALILAQLTKDEAAAILAKLLPREVEVLTREVVNLGPVGPDDVDAVMNELHALVRGGQLYGHGGEEFAREALSAGLGPERAADMLARIQSAYQEVPFASLRNADVRQLVTFLREEHPQLIALVLAHLPAGQSAEVLSAFPSDQQSMIAHRIATMERTAPAMVRLVEDQLRHRMGSLLADDLATIGGLHTLVEIINRSSRPTERFILEWLDQTDPELAGQVRAQMFVFEDIVMIDDRSLQEVLREVDAGDLAAALKGVPPDVRDKVQRNLSERAAENLAEEVDLLGRVRTTVVEEAQARIVGIIRAMEAAGVLTIGRGEEDMVA